MIFCALSRAEVPLSEADRKSFERSEHLRRCPKETSMKVVNWHGLQWVLLLARCSPPGLAKTNAHRQLVRGGGGLSLVVGSKPSKSLPAVPYDPGR